MDAQSLAALKEAQVKEAAARRLFQAQREEEITAKKEERKQRKVEKQKRKVAKRRAESTQTAADAGFDSAGVSSCSSVDSELEDLDKFVDSDDEWEVRRSRESANDRTLENLKGKNADEIRRLMAKTGKDFGPDAYATASGNAPKRPDKIKRFTRLEQTGTSIANPVYLARYYAAHAENYGAFAGDRGLLDAIAASKLGVSAAELAVRFVQQTRFAELDPNGVKAQYDALNRLITASLTDGASDALPASKRAWLQQARDNKATQAQHHTAEIIQFFLAGRYRDALTKAMTSLFSAINDWDVDRALRPTTDDRDTPLSDADIRKRVSDEENLPRYTVTDIIRCMEAVRDDDLRQCLNVFVETISDGESASDKNSSAGRLRQLTLFFPHFLFYTARWFDIYDATLKGEEVDSFLENVVDRNHAMRAETSRGSAGSLRHIWQEVVKQAPAGPAAPLGSTKEFLRLDDIDNVDDVSNPQIEEELAMLLDEDESCRIDASSLWNFKGDDFKHFWKYASIDEKRKWLEQCRSNMIEMEETRTGMFYCPEISPDELLPTPGSDREPLIELLESIAAYNADISRLDPFVSRLALYLQRERQQAEAAAVKELPADVSDADRVKHVREKTIQVLPFGRKTVSTIIYKRRVVLCKFLVNCVFVVLKLGEDDHGLEDAPIPLSEIVNQATLPGRKAPEFAPVNPGERPQPPPKPQPPSRNAEASPTASTKEPVQPTPSEKSPVIPGDVPTDKKDAAASATDAAPAADGGVSLSADDRAHKLQHSKLWDCAFPGCSNNERDEAGKRKYAACAFCKKVGLWVPYCSRPCQAKAWPDHKSHCGTNASQS